MSSDSRSASPCGTTLVASLLGADEASAPPPVDFYTQLCDSRKDGAEQGFEGGLDALSGFHDFGVRERLVENSRGHVGYARDRQNIEPMWRAAITSAEVDIPTRSAPMRRRYSISAGVS